MSTLLTESNLDADLELFDSASNPPPPPPDELLQFISYLHRPSDLLAFVQLYKLNGEEKVDCGFFKNHGAFREAVESRNGKGNLYVNLNELSPSVYDRAGERIVEQSSTRFRDKEIVRRRALLVDCDPLRASGTNATDDELQLAKEVSEKVSTYLLEQWGVEPSKEMSGNGYQSIYLIDEPTDSPLVAQVLGQLASMFSTDKVKIDTTVQAAAQICRLPGTRNIKGVDSPDRPQRMARLISVPVQKVVVSTDQLKQLIPSAESVDSSDAWTHSQIVELLETDYKQFGGHGWGYRTKEDAEHGTMYQLQQCPFIQHTREYRATVWLNGQTLCYKCFSDDCDGPNKKTAKDFVALIAPDKLKPQKVTNPVESIIELAKECGDEFFHDSSGMAFVTFQKEKGSETVPVRSELYQSTQLLRYRKHFGDFVKGNQVSAALDHIQAVAKLESPLCEVQVRYAELDGRIYIDLCDPSRR